MQMSKLLLDAYVHVYLDSARDMALDHISLPRGCTTRAYGFLWGSTQIILPLVIVLISHGTHFLSGIIRSADL